MPLENIQILKNSASDKCAAIKTPDGALHLNKVDDAYGADGSIEVEMTDGKSFIEKKGQGKDIIIFQHKKNTSASNAIDASFSNEALRMMK